MPTPIGLSASRAAAVLGLSPYQTPFRVWQDMMEARQSGFNAARGYEYEPFVGNPATRWGHAFEDAIIKLAEDRTGLSIIDREGVYHSQAEGMDYVTCHIDGLYHPSYTPTILHEGKTTTVYAFNERWGEPGSDRVPIEYHVQAQHQLACTGADECIISVLVFPRRPEEWEEMGYAALSQEFRNGDFSHRWAFALDQMGFFHQYKINADHGLHEKMLDIYKKWWHNHVINPEPPAAKSYDDIRAMITAPTGTIILDSQTARMYREYKDIGEEIGASGHLAKKREQLKKLILESALKLEKTLDDESTDKWLFMDDKGNRLGSYGRNKNGSMIFR